LVCDSRATVSILDIHQANQAIH